MFSVLKWFISRVCGELLPRGEKTCLRFSQSLTVYLIEAFFDTLANRAVPDQAALVRVYFVCLWKCDKSDPTLVDLTGNFLVLCTNMKVYLYNYSQ